MIFDPDSELSREELLQRIWERRLTPAQRKYVLADAEARGLTPLDLLRELGAEYDAEMADPIERENWLRIHQRMEEQRAMPFGPDPRIRQEDAHDDL